MDRRLAPIPGRLGLHFVPATSGIVASPTANTTTTYLIPLPPSKYFVERLAALMNTVIVDADGTALCTFYKYKASNDTEYALNTAVNLEGATTKETFPISITSGLAEDRRVIDAKNGDSLYVKVVSNSAAIDTAATGLCFSVELSQLQ